MANVSQVDTASKWQDRGLRAGELATLLKSTPCFGSDPAIYFNCVYLVIALESYAGHSTILTSGFGKTTHVEVITYPQLSSTQLTQISES